MSWSGGTRGRTSLIRSQGDRGLHILDTESRGQGAAPPIYVHGTNNKYRKRYMNVLVWGVVDRETKYHGKEVSIMKSLGSNHNTSNYREKAVCYLPKCRCQGFRKGRWKKHLNALIRQMSRLFCPLLKPWRRYLLLKNKRAGLLRVL